MIKENTIRWIILGVLILFSFIIMVEIKDQFPSGLIKYQNSSTDFLENITSEKSELHYYCSEQYPISFIHAIDFYIDEKYVKEGDLLAIFSQIDYYGSLKTKSEINKSNYPEIYMGLDKNKLKRIPLQKGKKELSLIYYNEERITVYSLICQKPNTLSSLPSKAIGIIPIIERPHFINSPIASITIFLTIFVLLYNFIHILLNLILGKDIFN